MPSSERITHLDAVRGVAVMGILIMNAVSFFLGNNAYFDISNPDNQGFFDWLVAGLGEVFADQKFMALFSLLFGASIILFCERADAKGRAGVRLSLWRNFILFIIGLIHGSFWVGDVLLIYAICAPVLLLCRKLPPTLLIFSGVLIYLSTIIAYDAVLVNVDPSAIRVLWENSVIESGSEAIELAGLGILYDIFARALGMMLIGMGLYASGTLTDAGSYRQKLRQSLLLILIGTLLTGFGLLWTASNGFSTVAIVQGNFANTLGTIPMTLGYLGLLTWWNETTGHAFINRVRAVGKAALSNYLAQTAICLTLAILIPAGWLTRSTVLVLIVTIWWGQLAASEWWLKRYQYGPLEYLWRCATYWQVVILKRG